MPASTIQTFILFLLMSAGFLAGKLGILDEKTGKQLSRFLVTFVMPCLIVVSMQKPLTPELRAEAFLILGLSFAIYAASFPLGFLLTRVLGLKGTEAGVHFFSSVFANVAFMGFPVVEALFGKSMLFAASIYNIPFQVLAFSVGAVMVSGGGGQGATLRPTTFITPAGVASLLGLALFLLDLALPYPLLRGATLIGDMTTPLSMTIIGASLSRTDFKALFADWRLWASSAYRLLLFPLALWLLLRGLGLPNGLLGLAVVMAAMPTAANSSILAAAYGGDHGTASSLVFLSTTASLVTIPLLASLLFGI